MDINPFDQFATDMRSAVPNAGPADAQTPNNSSPSTPTKIMGQKAGGGPMGGGMMGMGGPTDSFMNGGPGGGPGAANGAPPLSMNNSFGGSAMGGMGGPGGYGGPTPPMGPGPMSGGPPQQQQQPWGAAPPQQQGQPHGGPPPMQGQPNQQPGMNSSMNSSQGSWGGGAPPPMSGPGGMNQYGSGALVPSAAPSNPYAGLLGGPAGPGQGQPPQQQPPQQSNPFGQPQSQPQMQQPPQQGMQQPPTQQQLMQQPGQDLSSNAFGVAPAPPQPGAPSNDDLGSIFGAPAPAGQPQPPQPDPSVGNVFGAPPAQQPPQQRQMGARDASLSNIFGAPSSQPTQPANAPPPASQQPAGMMPFGGAPTPAPTPAAAAAGPADSFGGLFDAPSAPAPAPAQDYGADPWGQSAPAPPAGASTAIVPSTATDEDPFGIFSSGPKPAPALPPSESAPVHSQPPDNSALSVHSTSQDDSSIIGGTMEPPPPAPAPAPVAAPPPAGHGGSVPSTADMNRGEGGLPPGGEFYDARIFTPTLGVMFFKPQELTDSLFLQTDKDIVDALDERPVVAFIVEGSSARSAGVELGHVLLKVNGIDVRNPKEASRLIKEGPRPLPLLFYVPNTTVVVAEGEHMVKYDTRETGAPSSSKDWKPKYVVVGGIIAQNWMINMYRSKSEYDIAVIETQARRPVSVKVKQFSLQGARIQNDWQGPQTVKYKNKLHPWKYIVVLPVSRNPIKISSPNLTQLKPVHEGIRRVLAAQQRDRGAGPNTAAPIAGPSGGYRQQGNDPYRQQNGGSGGDPYGRNGGDPYGRGGGGGGYPQRDPYGGQGGGRDPYGGGGGQGAYRPDQGGVSSGRRTHHPDY